MTIIPWSHVSALVQIRRASTGCLRRVSVGQANKSCQSLHKDLPGYKHNFEAGPSTVTPYPQPTMRGLLMANQKLEVFTLLARLATPESQPSCRANVYDALQKKMQQLQPRDRCMPTINHQNGKGEPLVTCTPRGCEMANGQSPKAAPVSLWRAYRLLGQICRVN